MNLLAERVVKEAIASGVVLDAIADFDVLLELHTLADDLARRSERLDRLYQPAIACGNITLRPPTLAALEWIDRAEDWFAGDRGLLLLAQAFALAHPAAEVWAVQDPQEAVERMGRWMQGVEATPQQISTALETLLARPGEPEDEAEAKKRKPDPRKGPREPAYGHIIATLLRLGGNTPEYWIFEAPLDLALEVLSRAPRQEQQAIATASGQRFRIPDPFEIRMQQRFDAAARRFKASWPARVGQRAPVPAPLPETPSGAPAGTGADEGAHPAPKADAATTRPTTG